MQLETLYKRTKTGAIQFYDVCVLIADGQPPIIEKSSGRLGTDKPIVHREKITEGKNLGKSNETSPQQQAESQAQSDWRKKKDEGYKSLEDLGIVEGNRVGPHEIYYRSPADNFESGYSLTRALDLTLPQYNSGVNNIPLPMLAMDWKKVKTIPYPVYIQPKLDGVRCLMVANNENDITFLSRSGKEYTTLGHIREDVRSYMYSWLPGNFILDGEIYSDELSFQEITAAVKKQRPESLKLHFRAYDVVSEEEQTLRLKKVVDLVSAINSLYIHHLGHIIVENEGAVKEFHDAAVQQGYEGAMLRLPNGKYEQGARSRSLLKVKEFNEEEFRFVRWEQGQREEDLLAVCLTTTDLLFRAKMMGNRKEKEEMRTQSPNRITVKYFGLTSDGIVRFPIGKAIRDYE